MGCHLMDLRTGHKSTYKKSYKYGYSYRYHTKLHSQKSYTDCIKDSHYNK